MSVNCTEDYVEIDSKHGFTVEEVESLRVKAKIYAVDRAPLLSMIHTMRRWILILKYCNTLDEDLKNDIRAKLEEMHAMFKKRIDKRLKRKTKGIAHETCYFYQNELCQLTNGQCLTHQCPFYTKDLKTLMELIK